MRFIKTISILTLIALTQMSCIERSKKTSDLNPNQRQELEGPRVIRDTIIQVVLLDTVDNRPKQEVVAVEPPVATKNRGVAKKSSEEDYYDRGNSGFFDQYRSNYTGDPNENLQPTRKVIQSDNSDEIQRKKEALERSLDILEDRNKQEQERYQQLEREREAFNQRALQKAREQQQQQKEQLQQKQAGQKGKTLDTDLIYDKK